MTEAPNRSDRRRVGLLAGQAFALGLLMSWIAIPASAIFLSTYGAGLLPVTYIGAAVAGAASSAALSAALRRQPLVTVALRVLVLTSAVLVVVWVLLANDLPWVSFGLLMLVPVVVPMGFMLLVGQAGMLLDVRALKSLYARVIAGFALGFVAGGLAAPPLFELLGGTEHLVLGAAAAGGLWLGLLTVIRHQFRAELSGVDLDEAVDKDAAPTWGDLLRHRYVALIVAFQMLSAVESQWLDYLVYQRATERYQDSQDLAQFISRFTAIAYGADIVFLLLIAGLLLRRFGLRYGLTANPSAVLAIVGGVVALSALQGSGATVVFVLIATARVADLVLADGAARTSLSAAYQVVPTPMRLAAQAGVEGLAVPLAIGLSGVGLLLLQAATGTGGILLPVLVAVVVTAWLAVAVLVHRSYRTNLLTSIRFRTLDPAAITIDGANSLAVADRLLESQDPRDIRLGLDTLSFAEHPALADRLVRLTGEGPALVRADALERLARANPALAAVAARRGLDDAEPSMRARSVQVLATAGDSSALELVEARRRDPDTDVRVAALAAMARLGDDAVGVIVTLEVARLADDPDPSQRVLAARVLEACDSAADIDRGPLRGLLVDADQDIANAALGATRWPEDEPLLADVAARLGDRVTARAAVDALVRAGDLALGPVHEGLTAEAGSPWVPVHLARVARDVGGPAAIAVLSCHIAHADREVGLAVLSALGALVATADRDGWEHEQVDASLVVLADLEQATRILRALCACEARPNTEGLQTALRDELDLVRRRVLAGLGAHHGDDALERVSFQFAKGDGRSHALAVEWLDVALIGTDRAAVALLEPGLSEAERLRRLTRTLPLAELSIEAVLVDLITDPEHRWRQPWVQACALHAAWSTPEVQLDLASLDLSPVVELDGMDRSIFEETVAAIGFVDVHVRMASMGDHRSGERPAVNGRGGSPGGG